MEVVEITPKAPGAGIAPGAFFERGSGAADVDIGTRFRLIFHGLGKSERFSRDKGGGSRFG